MSPQDTEDIFVPLLAEEQSQHLIFQRGYLSADLALKVLSAAAHTE